MNTEQGRAPVGSELRLWIIGLIVGLSAAVGAWGQATSQGEIRKVAGRFADAVEAEDWGRAIELGHRLVELSPRNHVHPYNLACTYARAGRSEEALAWLERAAAGGFSNPRLMEGDGDLEGLRGDSRFHGALERVQANERRARQLFRAMAKGSEPVMVAPPGEGPFPVLVLLHGFGDSSPRFSGFFEGLTRKQGWLLVAPRSVIPTPNGGFEWGMVPDARWLVEEALKAARERYPVDGERIYLLGFSQGGRMAYEIGLELPETFAGVIPVGARHSSRTLELARDLGDEAPPFFLMAGGEEPAAEATRRAGKALKKAGLRVQYQIYPGVGHRFPPAWEGQIRRAISFFNKGKKSS